MSQKSARLRAKFCIDCNVPSALIGRLQALNFHCIRAPEGQPDEVVYGIAAANNATVITQDVFDFLAICAGKKTHPGIVTFPNLGRDYSKMQQNAGYVFFANWVVRNPRFDFQNKLVVVTPDRQVVVAGLINVKYVHHPLGRGRIKGLTVKQELQAWRQAVTALRKNQRVHG